jgi:hypothetical protein
MKESIRSQKEAQKSQENVNFFGGGGDEFSAKKDFVPDFGKNSCPALEGFSTRVKNSLIYIRKLYFPGVVCFR